MGACVASDGAACTMAPTGAPRLLAPSCSHLVAAMLYMPAQVMAKHNQFKKAIRSVCRGSPFEVRWVGWVG